MEKLTICNKNTTVPILDLSSIVEHAPDQRATIDLSLGAGIEAPVPDIVAQAVRLLRDLERGRGSAGATAERVQRWTSPSPNRRGDGATRGCDSSGRRD